MQSQFKVRRALTTDAEKIHLAHMNSIKSICSQHYDAELIEVWSGREFNREIRERAIKNDYVWVVLSHEVVEGFLHLSIAERIANVEGLYLSKAIAGQGAGEIVLWRAIDICKEREIDFITLNSTINAVSFYERAGFKVEKPEISMVAGIALSSLKMKMYMSSL